MLCYKCEHKAKETVLFFRATRAETNCAVLSIASQGHSDAARDLPHISVVLFSLFTTMPHSGKVCCGLEVNVCVFPSQLLFEMVSELQGYPGYPLGRFGAAITALTDINGDGLTDVAVGAPLEEQGAVYIFNGKPAGLGPQASQVRYPACPSHCPTRPEAS